MKVIIAANMLKALSLFTADKKEIRACLQGVYFEGTGKKFRAVATDGKTLLAALFLNPEGEAGPVDRFIVPSYMLKGLPSKDVPVTVERNEEELTLSYPGATLRGAPVDQFFPNYLEVIPGKVSGEPCHFNPIYLGKFSEAAKLLYGLGESGKHILQIAQNGPKLPSLVLFSDPNIFGLIVPCKADVPTYAAPIWARVDSSKLEDIE